MPLRIPLALTFTITEQHNRHFCGLKCVIKSLSSDVGALED